MADPLSVTASIIAVAGLAKATAKGIDKIVSKRHAPSLLLQLANEISELRILLQVANDVSKRTESNEHATSKQLLDVLDRAGAAIREAYDFIKFNLVKDPSSFDSNTEKIEVRWHVWARKEGKLRETVKRISEARSSISAAMMALNTISVMDLRQLQFGLDDITAINRTLSTSLKQIESGLNKRFDDLSMASECIQSEAAPPYPGSEVEVASQSSEGGRQTPKQEIVRVQSISRSSSCTCNCHSSVATRSPSWLGSSLGTMLVRYNRSGYQSCESCRRRSCVKDSSGGLKTQYYFPSWMLNRMVSMQYKWDPKSGHHLSLRAPRSVPPGSSIFTLAQHGNIQGIQRLFDQRLASPFDVSTDEGRSPLHFAMTATQPKMVSFLLDQGADPTLEDSNMLTAQDVCWNYFLQMPGNKDLQRLLFSAGLTLSDSESLDNRNFSPLHRIVLGLSSLDLRSYLDTTTADLNAKDSLGKTPLCWAASRPDVEMVRVLLEYGASLTLGDRRKQTPLHYSAGSGLSQSTELILEAAQREATGYNQWNSSMKDVSSDNVNSIPFFRGIINARDSKGRTPLTFAARMNFADHTQVLLSFGADPESVDDLARSTFLTSIYWKSHHVIPVLLAHGARMDVLDANGSSVLHYAAKFGDLRTLAALAQVDLGRLNTEAKDGAGLTPWQAFECRRERFVHEDEATMAGSQATFQTIMDNASGKGQNGLHPIMEIESDEEGEMDMFEDAVAEHIDVGREEKGPG